MHRGSGPCGGCGVLKRVSWCLLLMGLIWGVVGRLAWQVFEDVTGLAIQGYTDGLHRIEADGPGLARFQDRQVRGCDANAGAELVDAHLAFGHHNIQVNNNWHGGG